MRPIKTILSTILSVRRGREAVGFYQSAFGATELFLIENDAGEIVAQLSIDGAVFWVSDESPEHSNFSPESLGGATARMILTVSDPHAPFAKAIDAGAQKVLPLREEHGWIQGRVVDPYGHHWEIGRPLDRL